MITPKQVWETAEMRFWDFAIPLLQESAAAQKLVNAGYFVFFKYRPLALIWKGVFWACLGWIFGAAIGLVGATIFH